MNSRFCSLGKLLPYLFYLLVSYLLMMCWKPVRAQGVEDFKPLQIGDTVPDVTIKNILHYKTPTAKLSDFKGKLLILDFWATWCAPCVAMIPKMDSLQKKFAGKVQFLPVAYQSEKEVSVFIEKYSKRHHRRINLPEVVGDQILKRLFPHGFLPHYVWIDPDGVVKAITGMEEILEDKIASSLEKGDFAQVQKQDAPFTPYNGEKPLFINGNGGGAQNLIYHSLLTPYTEGIIGGFSMKTIPGIGRKITLTNSPRLWFYKIAYAAPGAFFGDNSVKLEVSDASRMDTRLLGSPFVNWMKADNGFCYELIVPETYAQKAHDIMQQDLKRFFPEYTATVETVETKVLVLTLGDKQGFPSSAGDKPAIDSENLELKASNVTFFQVLKRLNQLQYYPIPLIDETGWKAKVDIDLELDTRNVISLQQQFAKYGLDLKEQNRQTRMLVIRDSGVQP